MDTYKMDMEKDPLFRGEFDVVKQLVDERPEMVAAKKRVSPILFIWSSLGNTFNWSYFEYIFNWSFFHASPYSIPLIWSSFGNTFNWSYFENTFNWSFLATLVALHFTLVSKSVSQ